jgi:hypothetical protein
MGEISPQLAKQIPGQKTVFSPVASMFHHHGRPETELAPRKSVQHNQYFL